MAGISVSDPELATRLQLAIDRGDLSLAYQPKIGLKSGTVSGVEALARWHDPELGDIGPSVFVPLAERFGLIDSLTEWGLRSALRQWVEWRDQGVKMHIAFNISALSLRDVYLPDYIQRLCMKEGMPCDHLTVEVTESATQNVVRLLDTLTRFRLKGISVSLDDFGTGFSSLLQLRQLPYSEIKVDQCFVREITRSEESRLIVKAIVDLAHGMGLVATAEGVEDLDTLLALQEMGCDDVQGFLISPPLEGRRFMSWFLGFDPPAALLTQSAEEFRHRARSESVFV
jgi:EAL domain-containing protein (putative c-di-GMP-specific phosphodiesterase class I)